MKIKTKNSAHPTALAIVRKYHPQVRKVVDAKKNIVITVNDHDANNSINKDHRECAMAKACKRQEHADGVIISVNTAYIVKNGVAHRYHVPEAVSREVISFDRLGGFAPGTYQLNAPSPSTRLDHYFGGPREDRKPHRKFRVRHVTKNIRTSLMGA